MERIEMGLATAEDAAELLALYAPYVENTNVSLELEAPTVEEFARRIETVTAKNPYLVCRRGGELLGYCYAGAYRERAGYRFDVEVSNYVSPAYQGRHIGKALYTALFRLLEEQGYYHAYAAVTGRNQISLAMHQAFGFIQLGVCRNVGYKRGRWEDVIWMERLIQPLRDDPEPTRTIHQLCPEGVRAILEEAVRLVDL